MIKQLKELCIKTEQGSNLSECLNKYTKTQIKNILDLYGVKVASAAKKQEMTDAAEAAIKENAAAYFESDEGRTQRPLIDAMIAAPLRLNSSEDFEKIKNIYDKGIVFLREDGEEAETLVPANIIAILDSVSAKETDGMGEEPPVSEKRIPKAAAAERSEKEAEIIRFAGALANIYGVYTMLQLKDVWDYTHQRGIAPAELQEAVGKAGDEDGFYQERGFLISTLLDSEEAYRRIIEKYGLGDTYYYPTMDVIDRYDGSMCMDDSPEYVYLRSFIERKCGGEKIEHVMKSLHLMALRDVSPNGLVDYLAEEGVDFTDLEELNQFFALYTAWFYNLRIWVCKGYKPSELKDEKLSQRNFKLPAGAGANKARKIGRNDPCPCCSGKKYKNCCMRKIG